ncbi:MAG: DUF6928 family protein [Pseudomonadales bacterium]
MGASTWMLVYSNGNAGEVLRQKPELDRAKSLKFAEALFPETRFRALEEVDLSNTRPRGRDIHVGCYGDVSIVAAKEFGRDHPSKLSDAFVRTEFGDTLCLHAMHSVVDFFAYAIWRDGVLTRSLSLSPDSGIIEDIGEAQEFEQPYWAGERPVVDDADESAEAYPLPFHPLELGEAALLELFGYQLEALVDRTQVQPEDLPMIRLKRSRKWRLSWRS